MSDFLSLAALLVALECVVLLLKCCFENVYNCVPMTKRMVVASFNNAKRDLVEDYRVDIYFKRLI